MGDHRQALQHAHIAIGTLLKTDEETNKISLDTSTGNNKILAVAFFNLGVEFEHLKRYKEALAAYHRALRAAESEGINLYSLSFSYFLIQAWSQTIHCP
jgi:hypothetical protein